MPTEISSRGADWAKTAGQAFWLPVGAKVGGDVPRGTGGENQESSCNFGAQDIQARPQPSLRSDVVALCIFQIKYDLTKFPARSRALRITSSFKIERRRRPQARRAGPYQVHLREIGVRGDKASRRCSQQTCGAIPPPGGARRVHRRDRFRGEALRGGLV
jgi:hypothetical protein